jgi:hypothetical protein
MTYQSNSRRHKKRSGVITKIENDDIITIYENNQVVAQIRSATPQTSHESDNVTRMKHRI